MSELFNPATLPTGPFAVKTGRTQEQPLFHSEEARATIFTVQLAAGYGLLPAGTVLAKNISAAGGAGEYVPYVPDDYTGVTTDPGLRIGRAFLVEDVPNSEITTVKIALTDMARFQVGDDLIIHDNTTDPCETLGAITAVTAGLTYATLTFAAVTPTAFPTSQYANVYVESGTVTNTLSTAVCILTRERDTGVGDLSVATAVPAPAVFKNATLYTAALLNVNAAANTALGASTFQTYTYF